MKFELPRGSFGGDFYRTDYFEILPNQPNYDFYTLSRILGSNTDVLGGQCPITDSTGLTRCQYDFRIASNDPNADIYTGKVDPDLKPFTQTRVHGRPRARTRALDAPQLPLHAQVGRPRD